MKKLFIIITILLLLMVGSVYSEPSQIFKEIKTFVMANTKPDEEGDYFLTKEFETDTGITAYLIGYDTKGLIGASKMVNNLIVVAVYSEKEDAYAGYVAKGNAVQFNQGITVEEADEVAREIFEVFKKWLLKT